ncbi:MAG: hypothetical protein JW829_12685 [Pirellulales bacterium]|nr:hypothetical protein [Pirellulales bacterium]
MTTRISFPAIFLVFGLLGCQNGAGPAIETPSVDPGDAASAALKQYDKDNNGSLSKAELAACPGLLPALANQQQLSQDQITARIESLYRTGAGLMSYTCSVQLDGKPLAGATVRIEPEPFLSDAIHAAEGTTSDAGQASLAIPDKELPESERGLHAVQPGIYKVKITHPSVKISPKYNTETTLGIEINPTGRNEGSILSLKSRP